MKSGLFIRVIGCAICCVLAIFLFSACDMLSESNGTCEHKYTDWSVSEAATCTAIGHEIRICKKCEWTEHQFTALSEHQWSASYSAEISSTQEKVCFYTCAICQLVKLEVGDNVMDTDLDGLSDLDETNKYRTDPLKYDTDEDGLSDGKEIAYGFDPNRAQSVFELNMKVDRYEDTVVPAVEVVMGGEQLDTLTIDQSDFFAEDMIGYMGKAYKYAVEGQFDTATISFSFDENTLSATADPVIYAFNESKAEMIPLETTVENNVASAQVDSFSTYILVDRKQYEDEFVWIDVWNTEVVYSNIEVVFVVDDSGSMDWNDPYNERLNVAVSLIDKLPQGSRIGVVSFENDTNIYTSTLVTDRSVAQNYLTSNYFHSSGSTYMYGAIRDSFSLFTAQDSDTMRVMIVLSDGDAHDTSLHNTIISQANAKDVRLYTIGLGSESSGYFTSYLKPLAHATNAAFYLSEDADQLAVIYDDIGVKIDLTTDTDNDGLSDYYETNMMLFNGQTYTSDKNIADTDGDGLLDGEEIKTVVLYSADGAKMTIVGRVYSNPSVKDAVDDVLINVRSNMINAGYGGNIALYRLGETVGVDIAEYEDLVDILKTEVNGGLAILWIDQIQSVGISGSYAESEVIVIQFDSNQRAQSEGPAWGEQRGYITEIVRDCAIMSKDEALVNEAKKGLQ